MRVSRWWSIGIVLAPLTILGADLPRTPWRNIASIPKPPEKVDRVNVKSWSVIPARQALQLPITFDFFETPLADAVEFWADYTGLPFLIDEAGLRDERLEANPTVTISAEEKPAQEAIARTLQQLGLTWIIVDEIIVITSHEEAARNEREAATPWKAAHQEGEKALARRVAISARNVSLESAVQAYASELKLGVVIADAAQPQMRKQVRQFCFPEIGAATGLKYLLRMQDLTYSIRRNTIVIVPIVRP